MILRLVKEFISEMLYIPDPVLYRRRQLYLAVVREERHKIFKGQQHDPILLEACLSCLGNFPKPRVSLPMNSNFVPNQEVKYAYNRYNGVN